MESTAVDNTKMVCDMDEHGSLKKDAFSVATSAMEAHDEEKAISKHIKDHFDGKYGPNWHCIVGADFSAFVSHESKSFIFFYVGKTAVCLYRA